MSNSMFWRISFEKREKHCKDRLIVLRTKELYKMITTMVVTIIRARNENTQLFFLNVYNNSIKQPNKK